MRAKLRDVASSLNLSPGLVSGVLNGRANVWASEETRARIFEAARRLNYEPNRSAQALSSGRTNKVALVYRRLEGTHYRLAYTGLVDVFSAELQRRGLDLVVANFADQASVLEHLRVQAMAHACDAFVLWGREADTEAQGELLESLEVPFLVKGRHEARHPHWLQLDFDHEWMTANALARLVSLGHERIAYLGFPHDEAFVHALRRGFVEAHARLLGRTPDPELLAECEDEVEPNLRAIERWLARPERKRPTGFVVGAGNHAWHALEACLARMGLVLADEPGEPGAAGIASYYFTLMFGQAHAYQGIEIDRLAQMASPELLSAALGDTVPSRVIRFRPEMRPAPSLALPLGAQAAFPRDRYTARDPSPSPGASAPASPGPDSKSRPNPEQRQ